MTRTFVWCVAMASAAAACTEAPVEVSKEARALGITSFEVTESVDTLVIQGLDDDGKEVARLDLAIGKFTLVDEVEGTRREVAGRNLKIDVRGETAEHTSGGFGQLKLPPLLESTINDFVYDPTVLGLLDIRGVGFDPRRSQYSRERGDAPPSRSEGAPSGSEASQYACNPMPGCTVSSCAQTAIVDYSDCDNWEVTQYVCCSNTSKFNMRKCSPYDYGWTSCGEGGANGCSTCWPGNMGTGYAYESVCSAYSSGSFGYSCWWWGDEYWLSNDYIHLEADYTHYYSFP